MKIKTNRSRIIFFLVIAIVFSLIPSTAFSAGMTWIAHNEGLSGGDIRSLAIAPNRTNLLAGSHYGGAMYRSTDSGATWDTANTGLAGLADLFIPDVIYTSNTTAYAAVSRKSVYKTVNNGDTWTQVANGLPSTTNPTCLVASPNFTSDNTLFFGTQEGVYRSTTVIESWSEAGSALSGEQINDLVLSPNFTSDGVAFAAVEKSLPFEGGIWKWTNASGDWIKIYDSSLTDMYIDHLAISPNYASDQTLYAGSISGLYKSTNGGVTWDPLVAISVQALAVSPNYGTDGTVVYSSLDFSSNYEIHKSTDFGATWDPIYSGLPNVPTRNLIFDPAYSPTNPVIYAGTNGGGVYKTYDSGGSWMPATEGIIPQIKAMALSPNYTTDQTIFLGPWGGGVHKSTNGGISWEKSGLMTNWIKALVVSPSYTIDQTLFAGTSVGVYKSEDGGGSWNLKRTGLTNGWTASLAISPDYYVDQTLFTGTIGGMGGGVFKTINKGETWTEVNTGMIDPAQVWALAISPGFTNDQTVFAGLSFNNGIYKTVNGGGSWTKVLDSVDCHALTLSPYYTSDGIVFAGTRGDGVYRSKDFGATWEQVLYQANAENIYGLALSPEYSTDGVVYAAAGGDSSFNIPGEGGVWRSIDGGESWVRIYQGMSDPSTEAVLVDPNDSSHAFLGTYQMGFLENKPSFIDIDISHWAFWYVELLANTDVTGGYPDDTYRPENQVTRAEMAVFLLNGMEISPPAMDGSHPFTDISGHWAEAYIEELFDQGVTGGYPDGTYKPENRVTRAEMAVFLLNGMSSTPPAPDGSHPFSDIAGHWAEAYIEELNDQGITGGYPDGTYRPENLVTRAEMAVFLVKGFDIPNN